MTYQEWNRLIRSGAVPDGAPKREDGTLYSPEAQVTELRIPEPDSWWGHRPQYGIERSKKLAAAGIEFPAWGMSYVSNVGVGGPVNGVIQTAGVEKNTYFAPPQPPPLPKAPPPVATAGNPSPLAVPTPGAIRPVTFGAPLAPVTTPEPTPTLASAGSPMDPRLLVGGGIILAILALRR